MFQKVPESTPNMRGFAPFWFRQIRGHSLYYSTQDVRFSASFKEIFKQPTGNPPRCKTQICSKHIGVVVHLPQLFLVLFYRKVPPAATSKVGVKKFDGPKTYQIDWEWSQNASHRALSTLDKNYPPRRTSNHDDVILTSFWGHEIQVTMTSFWPKSGRHFEVILTSSWPRYDLSNKFFKARLFLFDSIRFISYFSHMEG